MIVYPGERIRSDVLEGFEDAAIGRSLNGWMDSELFLTWLTDVFIPGLNERKVKRPVLLFVDGHSTHVSMEVSNICLANEIHVFCLLEHASHLIQPLDLRVFGVLKENWGQSVRDFQLSNIPNTVTKKSFAQVFKIAWDKSATVENAIKAFKYAGLFPLDKSIVLKTAKMDQSLIYSTSTFTSSKSESSPSLEATKVRETGDDPTATCQSAEISAQCSPPKQASASYTNPASVSPATQASASHTNPASVSPATQASASSVNQVPASPFSKHLSLPISNIKRKETTRVKLPKAITGEALKYYLKKKNSKKSWNERKWKERRKENVKEEKKKRKNFGNRQKEKKKRNRKKRKRC